MRRKGSCKSDTDVAITRFRSCIVKHVKRRNTEVGRVRGGRDIPRARRYFLASSGVRFGFTIFRSKFMLPFHKAYRVLTSRKRARAFSLCQLIYPPSRRPTMVCSRTAPRGLLSAGMSRRRGDFIPPPRRVPPLTRTTAEHVSEDAETRSACRRGIACA